MPLKSGLMLSPLSLNMREMAELLEAEQPELDLLVQHARQVLLEGTVSTSSEAIIGRYEQVYGLPAGGKTLEERRAALLFLINARMLITPAYMAGLAKTLSGRPAEVREYPDEYRFEVVLSPGAGAVDLARMERELGIVKPAHLVMECVFETYEEGLRYNAVAMWEVDKFVISEV